MSVLTIHSLLEDMYGFDGIVNTLLATPVEITNVIATAGTGGQLLDIQLSAALPLPNPPSGTGIYNAASTQMAGFFNGRVMTMTSGPFAGRSTRIVGYDPGTGLATSTGTPTLRVITFQGTSVPALANQTFVINGAAFNGVGFGYNPNDGLVDANDGGSPAKLNALLPNPKYPSTAGTYSTAYSNFGVTGVANATSGVAPTRTTTQPIGTTCCWD